MARPWYATPALRVATALKTYESVGFKKRGKWIDKGVEFGPNCLATRQLIYK